VIFTIANFKGGVAKTTTAVHIATYLQLNADTVLIDSDPNRSASGWAKRGELPFRVIDERQAAKFVPKYQHVVIDTQARPTPEDLEALAEGCDLLILPSTPDALSLDALIQTVGILKKLGTDQFKILLTVVPPHPSKDEQEARATLNEMGLPLFKGNIRRLVAFQKAALAGVPVYEVSDPKARTAWEDYKQIGKELGI